MSLKDKVQNIRRARQPGRFIIPGYDTNDVLNTLFSYVNELEGALEEAKKPAPKKVKKVEEPKVEEPEVEKTEEKKEEK